MRRLSRGGAAAPTAALAIFVSGRHLSVHNHFIIVHKIKARPAPWPSRPKAAPGGTSNWIDVENPDGTGAVRAWHARCCSSATPPRPAGCTQEHLMDAFTDRKPSRRAILAAGIGAGALVASPAILRAQTKELVVGGAAGHKPWVEQIVIPAFEKKYNCKVIFEGTRSLVNLEKMQKNKDKPYMSVVQMDDPVMILAVKEGLLDPLTPAKASNLADLVPGSVHMDGMWANYLQPWLGIAYGKSLAKTPPTSWAEMFDAKYKGRIVIPSLQNTEGLPMLFVAGLLAGGTMEGVQKDTDAGFKKLASLKPNLLTIYTQQPQAYNLLEQGEAAMIGPAMSSYALERKAAGSPVDLAAPKEGVFAMPSGIAVIKGAPHAELAFAYVNEMLGADFQNKLAGPTYSLATNKAVPKPAGLSPDVKIHQIDWANVAAQRNDWIKRWDREMAI
jgi:putative spermidine/putrescine transport system substrate-binding protein